MAEPMKTLELHYSVIRFLIVIFNIPLFLAGLPQQTGKTRLHILATHLWYGGLLEIINSTSNKMTKFVGQCLHVVQKRPKFTNCTCMKYALDSRYQFNRPFLSCLLRQCQNLFSGETIHMEMCSPYRFIFTWIELIFIWKLCRRTRFETEACGNSEIRLLVHLDILTPLWLCSVMH